MGVLHDTTTLAVLLQAGHICSCIFLLPKGLKASFAQALVTTATAESYLSFSFYKSTCTFYFCDIISPDDQLG